MKKFWIIAALILAVGSTCFAAQDISISGGAIKGTPVYTAPNGNYLQSSNLGFYANASGAFQMGKIPFALTGSYSSYTADTCTRYTQVSDAEFEEEEQDFRNVSSLIRLFAGLTVPNTSISLGGGLVSQYGYWDDKSPSDPLFESLKVTGYAVAAFGSIPITNKAQIVAQAFYVPSATLLYSSSIGEFERDANGFGYEVSGSYQLLPKLALEAGYRSYKSTFKLDESSADKSSLASSNIFGGIKFSF